MVRWRCDLRPSRVARWLQRGLHGAVIGALLLSPWEGCWAWAKLPLLAAVVWEAQRAARRLNHLHGELNIDERGNWRWRGESWRLLRPPRWLPFGAQVALRSAKGSICRRRKGR
ncbi:protein YgfX [Pantoea sp.]|uniref:protein YgfX n=1 Tax=Pantoea sp. TaxID=69393 RepID=UPI0028A2787F|nr:protein YgfX [Pantoea sp.]